MLECAIPPRIQPTSASASFTNPWVMPERFMISPARMKNGMARNGNRSSPANSRSGAIVMKRGPMSRMPIIPAMPMAKPTGIPKARNPKKASGTR